MDKIFTPLRPTDQGGFTLVELLGVIAIIALMATVVISSIQGAVDTARASAAARQIQILNSAYQTYIASGGPVLADVTTVDEAVGELLKPLPMGNITKPIGPFLIAAEVSDIYTPMIPVQGTSTLNFTPGSGFALIAATPVPAPTP